MNILKRTPLPFIASLLLVAGAAVACPACKDAVASRENPAAARLTRGYARSIYLLMATPYLLFGGVALTIARASRRARK